MSQIDKGNGIKNSETRREKTFYKLSNEEIDLILLNDMGIFKKKFGLEIANLINFLLNSDNLLEGIQVKTGDKTDSFLFKIEFKFKENSNFVILNKDYKINFIRNNNNIIINKEQFLEILKDLKSYSEKDILFKAIKKDLFSKF